MLPDLVMFSIISSEFPLDVHISICVVPLKYLMQFLAGINTKQFWNITEEKYFAPLKILNLFIKSFVNSFVNIALTFFASSFNSSLLDVKSFSSLSKSVFFTKLAISFSLAKLACLSLAVKKFDINWSHSWVVMCLSWSWSVLILFSVWLVFAL